MTDIKKYFTNLRNKINKKEPSKQEEKKIKMLDYRKDNETRGSLFYKGEYICKCDKKEKEQAEKYFIELSKDSDLEQTKKKMRTKYNKHTKKASTLTFTNKDNGRVQVKIKKGTQETSLCTCDPSQEEEISRKYEELKNKMDTKELQKTFKQEYNLKKIKGNHQHEYIIKNTGAVYKDGTFIKVDKELYALVENRL